MWEKKTETVKDEIEKEKKIMRERERKREGGFKKDLLIKQKTYNKKQGLKDPKHTYHSHRLVNKFLYLFLSSLVPFQVTTHNHRTPHISIFMCSSQYI